MAKKEMNKDSKKFGKELKAELKKVTWPTFKGLVNSTSAVISIVVIVAVIVFVLDVCFENLNKFGVERLKTMVSSDTEQASEEETTDESDDESSNIDVVDVTSEEDAEATDETEVEDTTNSEDVAESEEAQTQENE